MQLLDVDHGKLSKLHVDDVCASTSWLSCSSSYSQESLNTVIMQGFLRKKGEWNPAWKSRYFVFDGRGRLHYFKDKNDSSGSARCLGSIPITSDTKISMCQDSRSHCDLTFEVRVAPNEDHSGRTFTLKAETHEEALEWVSVLSSVAERTLLVSFDAGIRHW
mmetsp:Transcript_43271/g.115751  ORF Transcript_43271/g.115751 Transcript_43271/m.115751 type:complete len:162 (-) Transcript_43271:34-519(-)